MGNNTQRCLFSAITIAILVAGFATQAFGQDATTEPTPLERLRTSLAQLVHQDEPTTEPTSLPTAATAPVSVEAEQPATIEEPAVPTCDTQTTEVGVFVRQTSCAVQTMQAEDNLVRQFTEVERNLTEVRAALLDLSQVSDNERAERATLARQTEELERQAALTAARLDADEINLAAAVELLGNLRGDVRSLGSEISGYADRLTAVEEEVDVLSEKVDHLGVRVLFGVGSTGSQSGFSADGWLQPQFPLANGNWDLGVAFLAGTSRTHGFEAGGGSSLLYRANEVLSVGPAVRAFLGWTTFDAGIDTLDIGAGAEILFQADHFAVSFTPLIVYEKLGRGDGVVTWGGSVCAGGAY